MYRWGGVNDNLIVIYDIFYVNKNLIYLIIVSLVLLKINLILWVIVLFF